jgi:lipopolysaccharide assembly protein A
VIIGGLIVLATLVLPLYARLRKANRGLAAQTLPPAATGAGV